MKTGTLFAVGIGPGDPDLITLKAVRVLRECPVIAVPRGKEAGESLALSIVERVVDLSGKRIVEIHFPMTKGPQRETLLPAARKVVSLLSEGTDVAFITIGDPTLYSTFFHLHDSILSLEPSVRAEIVPGVSSINASASCAGMSLALAGEKVAILPAAYIKDIGELITGFDTIILMKVHRVIDELREVLKARGCLSGAVCVSRAGLDGQTVKPLADVVARDLDYFSTVIVRAKNAKS